MSLNSSYATDKVHFNTLKGMTGSGAIKRIDEIMQKNQKKSHVTYMTPLESPTIYNE